MMKLLKLSIFSVLLFSTMVCFAQSAIDKDYLNLSWKKLAAGLPDEWYATTQAKMAADSVLKYQTEIGGWSKNHNYHKGFNQQEWAKIKSTGIGATFDNGATLTEMKFLVKMYSQVKDDRYKAAFNKGVHYILSAQYQNGGWPQFFPFRNGKSISYNSHITYNDNAMVNVMSFLKDIVDKKPFYSLMDVSEETERKAKTAFDKGVACILATQIKVNSVPTVWCAQHDEVTFEPANARAYELASFSGAESVGIALLLMDIQNPSKEVKDAVTGAKTWFENHKIEGIRLERVTNSEGKPNLTVVEDKSAPALWARFYDLDTELPYFCDRDGIKKGSLAEIGYERRNGYGWYTSAPSKLIQKYPKWTQKWNVD